MAHSTSVVMLLDADYTNSTAELVASLEVRPSDCSQLKWYSTELAWSDTFWCLCVTNPDAQDMG